MIQIKVSQIPYTFGEFFKSSSKVTRLCYDMLQVIVHLACLGFFLLNCLIRACCV